MAITIYKNNSRLLNFIFKKSDGTAWTVPSGNILKFSVKRSVTDTDSVIEKSFTGDGGNEYNIFLTGSDTNIDVASYKWDIKDTTANLTYIEPTDFIISEVVTSGDAITGSQNEDTDIVITVTDGVVSLSYSNLTNKPKINNVELNGNKTLSDLDIQPKLTAGTNITITDNVISATNTQYTAGSGIDITNNEIGIDLKNGEEALSLEGDKLSLTQGNINTSELNNDAGFLTSHQDISGKLDKDTSAISGGGVNDYMVYAKNYQGTNLMLSARRASAQNNKIPIYTDGGNLPVGTPTANNHATPKTYVDTADATKVSQVTTTSTNGQVYGVSSAGEQVTYAIDESNGITSKNYVDTQVATKQDTLTAGTGISIVNNVISVNLTNLDNEDF